MEKFAEFPGLVHGFSTRSFGNMKFGFGNDQAVIQNRERWAQVVGFDPKRIVEAEQVHGARIAVVGERNVGQEIKGVDGLVTCQKRIYLLIKTADCVPILFYDPTQKVAGIAHGGWRGILGRIASRMVYSMRDQLGCLSENILVGLGPSIGGCCYLVPKERALKFRRKFGEETAWGKRDKRYLDVRKATLKDLVQAGVPTSNIEASPVCTYCQNKAFFSFRKEGKRLAGETAGVIGIKRETTTGLTIS